MIGGFRGLSMVDYLCVGFKCVLVYTVGFVWGRFDESVG